MGLTVPQLAHELNSLLDGSLRSVGLALRDLAPADGGAAVPQEVVLARLLTAHEAMWSMAELLERAMRGGGDGPSRVLARSRPLGPEIEHIVALLRPWADDQGVEVVADVAAGAGSVPVGPLGAVVLNGMRNAVAACTRAPGASRRVDVAVRLGDGDDLLVEISDTGPGPGADEPGAGHGLGLGLCRQIVAELGGSLALRRGPDGGAVMAVRVPRGNLVNR